MARIIYEVKNRPQERQTLITMRVKCPDCGKRNTVSVWEYTYKKLEEGRPVVMTKEDRALVLTGICHECYFKKAGK